MYVKVKDGVIDWESKRTNPDWKDKDGNELSDEKLRQKGNLYPVVHDRPENINKDIYTVEMRRADAEVKDGKVVIPYDKVSKELAETKEAFEGKNHAVFGKVYTSGVVIESSKLKDFEYGKAVVPTNSLYRDEIRHKAEQNNGGFLTLLNSFMQYESPEVAAYEFTSQDIDVIAQELSSFSEACYNAQAEVSKKIQNASSVQELGKIDIESHYPDRALYLSQDDFLYARETVLNKYSGFMEES